MGWRIADGSLASKSYGVDGDSESVANGAGAVCAATGSRQQSEGSASLGEVSQ